MVPINPSEQFAARLYDLARQAARRGEPRFSQFLDPSQAAIAIQAAKDSGVSVAFNGGYEDAERQIAAFYEGESPATWPIGCVRMRWIEKFGSIGHRDLLGALMALGYERERLGDIAVGQGEAYVFASPEIAGWIAGSMESAGRVHLKCELYEGMPDLPSPEGVELRGTVSSLRLDAVLAEGFSLSRADAQQRIRQGLIRKNHVETLRTDADVVQGDMISARGLGRFRLTEVIGETRKGRIAILMFRYGEKRVK